ncbi:MAG TPA: hypothetical protein VF765_10390 [Polyangiaceae bacterium]
MKSSGLVLWASLATFGLTLSADGCGGRATTDAPTDGGSGSSSGITGSSSGVSGSSSGFAGSSSGITGSSSGVSGSSSGGGPNGSISIQQCYTAFCNAQRSSVYAQFFTTDQSSMGCTVTTAGSCTYYSDCGAGGPGPNGVSAGTLTVAGPLLMTVTATPLPPSNFYDSGGPNTAILWGQTLTVSATGATVPAFGPVSVVVPEIATIYDPPIDVDGGSTTIPTNADLVVAWTGGQPGAKMTLHAAGNSMGDYMNCTWNGADGKDIVPVAMLQHFSHQSGYVLYGQYNVTSFSAGPFAVTVNALPYAGALVDYQ